MPELYSTNSVGLHFREVIEIKKAAKENDNREPKWAGNIWREKTGVLGHLVQNFKNTTISSNFSVKLLERLFR